MKILCATDFTAPARVAAHAAVELASRLSATVHLVHVAHLPGVSSGRAAAPMGCSPEELARRGKLLAAEATQVRRSNVPVVEALLEGLPDEEVQRHAQAIGADLVVLGPTGERKPVLLSLGSIAARVIKSSAVPVFVARESASLERWAKGQPLRVVLGVDPTRPTQAALGFFARLRGAGTMDVCALHVDRDGSSATHEEIAAREKSLVELTRERVARVPGLGPTDVRVVRFDGNVAERLVTSCAEERAELLVIGSHRRTAWARRVHGSVALDIVARSRVNALVVPLTAQTGRAVALPPEVRRVLVPCDLSPLSKDAIAWACTLMPRGGTLHLLHVVQPFIPSTADSLFGPYGVPLSPAEVEGARREIESEMRDAVPAGAVERGLEVIVDVATAYDPAQEVARRAETSNADLICLSTHGRGGLSKLLLGSVATGIVRISTVPVLVVPPVDRS